MACAARVQQQRGIRQFLHQLAGATGMIQMYVGQNPGTAPVPVQSLCFRARV